MHRTLDINGNESKWKENYKAKQRRFWQIFWFPDRRADKAVFDVISELLPLLKRDKNVVLNSIPFRMLSNFVKHRINQDLSKLKGFQFIIVSTSGYEYLSASEGDKFEEPKEILISPFIPLEKPNVSKHLELNANK